MLTPYHLYKILLSCLLFSICFNQTAFQTPWGVCNLYSAESSIKDDMLKKTIYNKIKVEFVFL